MVAESAKNSNQNPHSNFFLIFLIFQVFKSNQIPPTFDVGVVVVQGDDVGAVVPNGGCDVGQLAAAASGGEMAAAAAAAETRLLLLSQVRKFHDE